MSEYLQTIFSIVAALFLAIFAKRYSDLKKRDEALRAREIQDKISKVENENNALSTDDLVAREQARFKSGRRCLCKK